MGIIPGKWVQQMTPMFSIKAPPFILCEELCLTWNGGQSSSSSAFTGQNQLSNLICHAASVPTAILHNLKLLSREQAEKCSGVRRTAEISMCIWVENSHSDILDFHTELWSQHVDTVSVIITLILDFHLVLRNISEWILLKWKRCHESHLKTDVFISLDLSCEDEDISLR